MHGKIGHVQNQHARWHDSEGINGGGQYVCSITYEFLVGNCNGLLKGLLLPITLTHTCPQNPFRYNYNHESSLSKHLQCLPTCYRK